QAGPGRNNADSPLTAIPDVRHDLVADVVIVLLLPDSFVVGMDAAVEPAFLVDAVDGKDFDLTRFDIFADNFDDVKAFVFEVIGSGRWEHEQREAILAVGNNLHALLQAGAEPSIYDTLHLSLLLMIAWQGRAEIIPVNQAEAMI